MEKKFLIPIVLGVLLLCGIAFTVVYKNTSGSNPNEQPEVQTLAQKETEKAEVRVGNDKENKLDDFDINEIKPIETIGTTEMEIANIDNIIEVAEAANNSNSDYKSSESVSEDASSNQQVSSNTSTVTVGIVDKSDDGTIIGLLPNGDAVSTLNTPDIGSSHVYTEAEAVALDSLNDYWKEHNISKEDLRTMLDNEVYKDISDTDKDAIANDIFEKNPHNNPTEKVDIPTENKEPEVILGDGPANAGTIRVELDD